MASASARAHVALRTWDERRLNALATTVLAHPGPRKAANRYGSPLSREAVIQLIAASAPGTASPPRPVAPKALSDAEHKAVLDALHSERFTDSSPAQVSATLLNEGRSDAERTMYRLLAECGEVNERRDQTPAMRSPSCPHSGRTSLVVGVASLKGPAKWTCYYL